MAAKILIIGASHAGISAGSLLKKSLGARADVTILEQGIPDELSFVGADGLLWVSGDVEFEHVGYTTVEKVQARGIDLQMRTVVTSVDFNTRRVYATQCGERLEFEYEYLILATGSHPVVPDFAAQYIDSPQVQKRVQTMKTLDDAKNLKAIAEKPSFRKVAVVGGGYIGVETAETLVKSGVSGEREVSIIQSGNRLCNAYYDDDFSALIHEVCTKNGVKITYNTRLEELDFDRYDAYILSLGFRANSTLGGDAIERELGAYKVDEFQKCTVDNVYAIGDAATSFNNVLHETQYLAIGSATRVTSAVVASHIQGEITGTPAKELRNTGTNASNGLSVFGVNLGSSGLTLETAVKRGINAKCKDFTGAALDPALQKSSPTSQAAELDGQKMKLRIVYNDDNQQILGFQIACNTDIGAYIYFFSSVLQQGMTLSQLETLDLFFLPQLNQLYNPISRAL
ncbi:MAG: FAD-dependent oxidoreductase [Candidatus Ancillula sp.]|jgi:NADPH-dependent 2,4-dienoyl-CoA reductase/sulfur reductase-like enzyme|nr:FAD-dependent oxidoreductase [Candidatus Ancillula sp.]